VEQLPLNGRQLIDLVTTVPGAHQGSGAQQGKCQSALLAAGQFSAISISGSRPNANYFLLDGATNTDPTFNTQNFSPSPDSVQEFQVQTGSYSAEMGGAGGGQINIATRSGTSAFHGSVYEFLRNGASMPTPSAIGCDQPSPLQQLRGGAGGPVYGQRTFFCVNYEGYRRVAAERHDDTVPT